MTTLYLFRYRLMDTANGPQEIGQWDYLTIKTDLLNLLVRREFAYSPGYSA
jgi:hypothetical protein